MEARGTGLKAATAEEKEKALEAARLQIEKQFGSGSLIKLGTNSTAAGLEVIPSGSILLDEALGIGGYPRGRIVEIYGPESSGKTTLALHAIAEAQKLGGIAAFVDAEHALDSVYARNLGVNTDDLWVSQPDSGEQALEITESLVRSGAVDVIVVDSVAALTPQAEIDGDMGDAHMGLQARLMSQALRKLTATISKSRTLLVFINQIRMKRGIMFGNPETTTGGNALKFYASIRLEVRKMETMEKGDADAVGNRVRVKVVKNKVAPPFRKVELELMFGKGISAIGSLLDAAVKYEIIDKKGAWFAYGEEKIGQGRDNAKEFLNTNPQLAADIENRLRALIFPDRSASPKPPASANAASAGAGTASAGATGVAGAGTMGASGPANASVAGANPAAPARTAQASDAQGAGQALPGGPRSGGIELKNEEPRQRGRPAGSKNSPPPENLF
ncbi:MAG: recombinase RecA [Spirochaetaceae bacterium]|nr:recombinase RecA [Spirochaetaceae bacterium]